MEPSNVLFAYDAIAPSYARHRGGETAAVGFRRIDECEGRSEFPIPDIGPYRYKAFSCLQLIPEEEFTRGLRAMESDLRAGPLKGTSEFAFLWAERP